MPPLPLIIGHRGAPALLPENTIESFRLAFEELNADAIEFDVRFSRDRVPVVIHDATLERTTNGRGFVAQQTFQELQKLDAGKGFRIPSLEEVFSLFKAKTLAVEIKDKSEELVHSVMALIHQYKADHCIVGSKHFLVASTLRKHYPQQTRFLSQREIVQNFIASRVSKAPAEKDSGAVASMPLEGCGMRFDEPAFLDWLHRKEMNIYFWTINEPQEIRRLAAAGADGIITNHPGLGRQALER
ncbi:MAG TPA: glycerophosphodiester phosphodiesterase family protein [bacterium]|nr:glycerophosphodiester phosphodiesterase family protein [bacterium]